MILWIDGNEFGFFRSKDLLAWEETQRITLPGGYECPNLAELFTEEGQESCWIVFDAGGRCYTGEYDGYRFAWSGKIQQLFADQMPYAAQLYEGTPGRCVLVPWLRTEDAGKKYHCSAGLPRELYLKKEADGSFFVCQKPIAEYEQQKMLCDAAEATEICILPENEDNVELTILTEGGENLTVYYESNGLLILGEKEYRVPVNLGQIRVLADDRIVEIFLEDTVYITAELPSFAAGFEIDEQLEVSCYRMKE